ncbi:serpentine type 7TM GPCR chemoreceptor srsx domain-containing protein [Ditylenchus destructor]|uniref:Serpentine type 7TM GPCR chemoreceptor srsx domain-containing protein n=1 Tax=Ditylenchus destructor TaxID=166010 RepID=A0AAD4MHN6_9BILA|nr:serpentine type 7TM GPCR chemoreceptor srsx domain-containing protein [Ditylenchus destructor]
MVYGTRTALDNPNLLVVCFIGESLHGEISRIAFVHIIMFNCATVLCYVCLWLVCRLKSSVRETSTKVLKSLTVITAVVLMGWTINAVVLTVSGSILKLDMVKLFFLELYFGINVLASCSANYLILYKFR